MEIRHDDSEKFVDTCEILVRDPWVFSQTKLMFSCWVILEYL